MQEIKTCSLEKKEKNPTVKESQSSITMMVYGYHKIHSITACWILSVGKTYEFIIDYPNYNSGYKQINWMYSVGGEQWHPASILYVNCSICTQNCLEPLFSLDMFIHQILQQQYIWYPTHLQQEPGLCFLLWMNRKKLWLDGPVKAKVVDTSQKSRLGKDQGLCSVLKM